MTTGERVPALPAGVVTRLFRQAKGSRWELSEEAFARALGRSVAKAFHGASPSSSEVERYLESLHLEDLALAVACASGSARAWEHFIEEVRPVLRRSADAIDPSGEARDLADSLYADLYGLRGEEGSRRSLFDYFHGRSSLRTWLRAVLAQRFVDRTRHDRRFDPLPADESGGAAPVAPAAPDPDRSRFMTVLEHALGSAISRLDARDRLRLGCYYAQGMTLAAIAKLLREHEATCSRHLARIRRAIREDVETELRSSAGFTEREIDECVRTVADDAGSIDVAKMLSPARRAHANAGERSQEFEPRSFNERGKERT